MFKIVMMLEQKNVKMVLFYGCLSLFIRKTSFFPITGSKGIVNGRH